MYCKNCGRENAEGSHFCMNCRTVLNTQKPSPKSQAGHTPQRKTEESKPADVQKKPNHSWIGYVLAFFAIIFLCVKVVGNDTSEPRSAEQIVADYLADRDGSQISDDGTRGQATISQGNDNEWNLGTTQKDYEKESSGAISELQIISDIYENNYDLYEANLQITKYDITSQVRDDDMEIITLWVSYEAENAEEVYYGDIELYYQLEGKIWVFHDWQPGYNNRYIAKFPCDPSVPLTYLENEYAQTDASISMLSQDSWSDNECCFTYQVTGKASAVCYWTDGWSVDCTYDLFEGWQVTDANGSLVKEVWDICGTYACSNENISAKINLSAFEIDVANQTFTATISYSLTSYMGHEDYWSGPAMQQGVTYSNGPATFNCSLGYDNEYVVVRIGDYVDLYICGRDVDWDFEGAGTTGLWIKVLGNYSNTYGEYWLHKE